MKKYLITLSCLAVMALCGCASMHKPEGRPLAYIVRTKPALDTPIECKGCWASLSTVDKNGYFLFFSQTRPAPRLTEYLSQLEDGSGCGVLKDTDIYEVI